MILPQSLTTDDETVSKLPVKSFRTDGVSIPVKTIRIVAETEFDTILSWMCSVFFIVWVIFFFLSTTNPALVFLWKLSLFLVGLSMTVKLFTDATYVIDKKSGVFLLERTLFGLTTTWAMFTLKEVNGVGIELLTRRERHRKVRILYRVIVCLTDSTRFPVTVPVSDFVGTRNEARKIAAVLSADFLDASPVQGSMVANNYELSYDRIGTELAISKESGSKSSADSIIWFLSGIMALVTWLLFR